MQKNLAFFSIALLAIISVTKANDPTSDTVYTCYTHPAYPKVKALISSSVASDEQGTSKSNTYHSQYLSASPTAMNNLDMGVCKDYAGQKTCCNKNMIELIDKAAYYKVKPILQAKSAFQKLVNVYAAQVKKLCAANVLTDPTFTGDQVMKNTALKNFQDLRDLQKRCKVLFASAISSYTRAAMCTICAGVEKIGNYFNTQGQLKVTPDSLDKFTKDTDLAITCTANLFSTDKLDKIFTEMNKAYIKGNDACGAAVSVAVKTIFTDPKVKNDDGKQGKLCKGTTIFGDNSACENALQGDPTLETKTRILRGEDQSMLRLLQATPDAVSDQSGVSIYTTSLIDSTIDENGTTINGNFSQIGITKTSSSSKLVICTTFVFSLCTLLLF